MRSKSEMYRHQQAVATEFYERDVLAVVPMGGGKTASGSTAIRELIDDGAIRCAVILAPKRVAQLVWPKEKDEWEHLSDLRVSLVTGGPAGRMTAILKEADIYVVGIDNVQWLADYLKTLPPEHKLFDYLAIDEISRFKNPRGKRYKALRNIMQRFRQIVGMTGTPRPNGYEDLFAPLTLISRGTLWGKSFDRWRDERFMALDFHGHRWSIRPEWRDRTIADARKYMFTISPDDMPDMPELVTSIHWVDLPPAARDAYKSMERQLLAPYKNGSKLTLAANQAVATGKLAQMAQGFMYTQDEGSPVEHLHTEKADLLVELTEDLNENLLIVYEFQEDLRVLRGLYPGLPWLGAGVTDAEAADNEKQWNARQIERMALHPASAAHGLNLQRGGNRLAFYGFPWSAELFDQIVKRVQRPGSSADKVFLDIILARGTVDEMKYDRVIGKMTAQQAFNKYLEKV